MLLTSKKIHVDAPKGTLVGSSTFYTRMHGTQLKARITYSTRSDTTDISQVCFSSDNGTTWTDPVQEPGPVQTATGTLRRICFPGVINPQHDELLTIILQGVLPSDNPLEGQMRWSLRYAVSVDGGHTSVVEAPVVQQGTGYSEQHPLAPVWVGKNAVMIGDKTCVPIWRKDGTVLVPVQISPLDNQGRLYNPGGGYTYHNTAVLLGKRTDGPAYQWELSDMVALDPALSTRGCFEPTLAELADGRVLMVMRGSNDKKPELPGRKWFTISNDGGHTWAAPQAWGYSDGGGFFSPSACSQLLPHHNGKLYWIGNIVSTNPRGNLPRFPLVAAEVDFHTLMLVKESVFVVDNRQPGESENLTLSNFYAREDRVSGEIVIHCARWRVDNTWAGSAYQYRVAVD